MADTFQPDASLLPLLPAIERAQYDVDVDPFADHVHFAAEESAKGWAVYHEPKPERLGNGSTSYGLRIPLFRVFEGIVDPQAIAERAAMILNQHWYEGGAA